MTLEGSKQYDSHLVVSEWSLVCYDLNYFLVLDDAEGEEGEKYCLKLTGEI